MSAAGDSSVAAENAEGLKKLRDKVGERPQNLSFSFPLSSLCALVASMYKSDTGTIARRKRRRGG
jgi:hypothetical protein